MISLRLIACALLVPLIAHSQDTCERVLEGHLCPDSVNYIFTESGCDEPVVVFSACEILADLEDIAPTPPIDPDFDEHSPEGPGPGPPGAKTVDKP